MRSHPVRLLCLRKRFKPLSDTQFFKKEYHFALSLLVGYYGVLRTGENLASPPIMFRWIQNAVLLSFH